MLDRTLMRPASRIALALFDGADKNAWRLASIKARTWTRRAPSAPATSARSLSARGSPLAMAVSYNAVRDGPLPLVTRFAPAPTGFLHLGHVLNALWVWETARAAGHDSRVLLRIEDHDRQRSRPTYEASILEDLSWLGFIADGVLVRQSERHAVYEEALESLRRRGLVYACACSRSEIAGQRYPGTCVHRNLPEAPGLGLRVRLDDSIERFDDARLGAQAQQPSMQCGDLLAKDREGNWTYQFAVVVDDWTQDVNLVVRGEDLLDSTGRQIQLARLMGRPQPPAFLHHPLIMKSATQKLSKSDADTGIRELRARGWSAEQVVAAIPRELRP